MPFIKKAIASLGFSAIEALTLTAAAEVPRRTADAIRLDPSHPNAAANFAPELPAALARAPDIDPETRIHVREIEPSLYFVTEGVYQAAFLVTRDGVIVFDAPPSFAPALRQAIEATAQDKPIRKLIYSHGHSDHIGGAHVFADVAGLEILASAGAAESLSLSEHPGILKPTKTFRTKKTIRFGGEVVKLRTAHFHAEDEDTIIHLPEKNFLMAVDTITPGEVPFMNFGATSDFGAYARGFDTLLAYEFDHILTGHVGVLGTREDVILNKDYVADVRLTALKQMANFNENFGRLFSEIGFKNPNLAYRLAIEEARDNCAAQIIPRWQDKLSVVDIWGDSHCETVIVHAIMHH